jgi:hypothetical protein
MVNLFGPPPPFFICCPLGKEVTICTAPTEEEGIYNPSPKSGTATDFIWNLSKYICLFFSTYLFIPSFIDTTRDSQILFL